MQCTGNPLHCHLSTSAPPVLARRNLILPACESTRLHIIPFSLLSSVSSSSPATGSFHKLVQSIASIALAHLHKPATQLALLRPEESGCHQGTTTMDFFLGRSVSQQLSRSRCSLDGEGVDRAQPVLRHSSASREVLFLQLQFTWSKHPGAPQCTPLRIAGLSEPFPLAQLVLRALQRA